ncbi:MAG TPA: ammonia-forming cytochrome c nitrite reductase subunit c552 [Bryobacteraceae bacterium]|nr:ammonia-forming cytochrome c nitrite reductase subunit c552 [Bryobacteraceae bacterium]
MRMLALILFGVSSAPAAATYVGADACQKCHSEAYRKWSDSRHSKMLQPAIATAVKGDFARGRVTLRGLGYGLSLRAGVYYITESYLTGKPVEHRVDYTLGNRRIQHYLTTLPDGRIIVLPPSWDVLRKEWFHNFDIGDPDESGQEQEQLWNKNCFSCHVSQEEKNFNTETIQYKTSWTNFGTNCERCHGPGSEHVARLSKPHPNAAPAGGDMVIQTRLDPARDSMVCAQCHSFRDIFIPGYAAGEDYYNYFLPILEYDQPTDKDPAYWPDGRTRRFSNDALGLWQSRCFLKGGATCVTCHVQPHDTGIEKNAQLRPDATILCTRCHGAIGKAVSAHTHHAVRSTGSQCVECHMPRTVVSIKARIRDHSITIPVPDNTVRHDIPNACNECHQDRGPAWAVNQMNQWYGDRSRKNLIRRADAFAAARKGDATSVPALAAIASNFTEDPLSRANAVGYLATFPNEPSVFPAIQQALFDPHPAVRSVAALRLTSNADTRQAAAAALIRALGDSSAVVTLAAATNLIGMGVKTLPGEDGARLERAKLLYQRRAQLNRDDAVQQMSVGWFYLILEDGAAAANALNLSLRLDPTIPAKYFLAYAYAQQKKFDQSRDILVKIPPSDPQYAKAQELLRAIGGGRP